MSFRTPSDWQPLQKLAGATAAVQTYSRLQLIRCQNCINIFAVENLWTCKHTSEEQRLWKYLQRVPKL